MAGCQAPLWHLGQLEGLLSIGGGNRGRVSMEGHWGYAAIETLAGNIEQVMADIFFGIVETIPA